mmetsp:Transcript_93978/g.196064  ORF Transcript_93978/g.196064 Transcript_93978/m.196064 type:complete len:169 (+) Transcript_93978:324-830(+)
MLCCILSVCWVVLVSVFSDISPCTGDVGPTRSQVKTKVKKFDFLMIEQLTRAVRHKPEPDELDQLLKKSYSSLMRAPLDPCQLFSRLLFMLFNWPSETEARGPMTSNKVKSVEDSVALRVLEDSMNLRRFDDPELRDLRKIATGDQIEGAEGLYAKAEATQNELSLTL